MYEWPNSCKACVDWINAGNSIDSARQQHNSNHGTVIPQQRQPKKPGAK